MSSLRLALKKSLEENPNISSSISKQSVFDQYTEFNAILKANKPKRRRSSSLSIAGSSLQENTDPGELTDTSVFKKHDQLYDDSTSETLYRTTSLDTDIIERSQQLVSKNEIQSGSMSVTEVSFTPSNENLTLKTFEDLNDSITMSIEADSAKDTEEFARETTVPDYTSMNQNQDSMICDPPTLSLDNQQMRNSDTEESTIELQTMVSDTVINKETDIMKDDRDDGSVPIIERNDCEYDDDASKSNERLSPDVRKDIDAVVVNEVSNNQITEVSKSKEFASREDDKSKEKHSSNVIKRVRSEDDDSIEEEQKVEVKKRKKSSMLKLLGVPETLSESIDECDTNEFGSRFPSRAAAVVAKSRLSQKPPNAVIGVNVTPSPVNANRDDDQTVKKVESSTKKSAKKNTGNSSTPKTGSTAEKDNETVTMSSTTPAAEAPWACCDTCEKWRKLPSFINPSSLPDKWFCWMNEWDSSHNNCDAPEQREEDSGEEPMETLASESVDEKVDSSHENDAPKVPKISSKSRKPPRPPSVETPTVTTNTVTAVKVDNTEVTASRSSSKRKTSISQNTGPVRSSSSSSVPSSSISPEADKVNWVQCNRCSKWRKVSPNVSMDSLPDTWLCELNTWNPTYSKCSAKQEPDTDANSLFGNNPGTVPTLTRSTSQSSVMSRSSIGGKSNVSSTSVASTNVVNPNGASSNTVPTPKKITIQWVCCERKNCQKWRKIPLNMSLNDLPEKWFCELNTWDSERASCDAPEESDNENEIVDTSGAVRSQLILANSKGPGALSYRRIIFGTDGKIRPIYSEKSKTGHGLFSFTEKVLPIYKNVSCNNEVDVDDSNTKRVSYWYSSLYDESGLNYSSTAKGRVSTNGITNTSNTNSINNMSKSQIKLEELSQYYSDGPSDSILHHFANSALHETQNETIKFTETVIDDSSNSDLTITSDDKEIGNIKRLEGMSEAQLSPCVPTLSSDYISDNQVPLRRLWPKKVLKVNERVENASFFEKRELFLSLIRTCLLANDNLSLSIITLYDMIKSSYFANEMLNYYKNCISIDSLKMMLRFMEETGEIYVTTDSVGLSTIHYSRLSTYNIYHKDQNNNDYNGSTNLFSSGVIKSSNVGTLLPPKLRNKKTNLT